MPHKPMSPLQRFARLSPLTLAVMLALCGCAADQHHRGGLRAMEQGDYVKGVAELQLATEMEPQDPVFRKDWLKHRELATRHMLNLADNAVNSGRADVAEQQYRQILQYEPGNERVAAGLAKLGRLRRAADTAVQARAAFQRGEQRLAAELSARALEDDPSQADARALRNEIDALEAKQMVSAPSLDAMYRKPINLEFRDASVKMVFDALTRTTGINFIFDRDARSDQRTTVLLRQITLEDAIDVILTTNQLEKKILSASSVLIYSAGGAKAKEYQELVVRAFYLTSAEAKQTASLLKTMLKIKDVFIDEKMNMLVLREPPDTIALAEKLIGLHDLDRPEVMLEVEVLEVTRSRLLDLGIKVTDSLTVSPLKTTGFSLDDLTNLTKSALGVTVPSATLTFNADNRDTNLLANPRIRVHDREKARFMIGDKVPVVTTTNTSTGLSTENITYQDVGLKIEVEPEVHLRDEVLLKLSMEVSSLVSSMKTNNGSLAYQIGTRSLSSVLRLKDGETQVLAGLISDEDRSSANGLPFLNELPVLGRLFSAKQDNRLKTEIVLSITPHLIRNMERKAPSAESFWSGTETTLRTKPLQLRSAPGSAPAPLAPSNSAAARGGAMPSIPAMPVPGAARLRWVGPAQGKVGTPIVLELRIDSSEALRAAPLQLGFNPALFQVLSVKDGDFFGKNGPASFSHNVDKASGRISVGSAGGGADGAKGEARLLQIELMPLQAAADAQISVIGMTPIGHVKPVPLPALPLIHALAITPAP